MSTNTWGMLPKNLEDAEKIEEAIARLIEAHENDPTAHLSEGQSLKSHRAQEVIDHVAGSVVEEAIKDANISLRKITDKDRVLISAFESMDGWNTSGNIHHRFGSVRLGTNATIDATASLSQVTLLPFLDYDKEILFQFAGRFSSKSNVLAYMGISNIPYSGDDVPSITFKVSGGALYIEFVGKDTSDLWQTTTEEIEGIDPENLHIYRILHQPEEGKLEISIDGVIVKTFTENLPSGAEDPIATFDIKTQENAEKYLTIMDLMISVREN